MILVDTSAWIEHDRATGSPCDLRMQDLLARDDPSIAVTEPVTAEVLAGARTDARERQLPRLLDRCALLPFETPTDFDGAVRIYRACRQRGTTFRSLHDCLIAAVALRHGAPVLAHDTDFARMASVVPLALDLATQGTKPA
ncbi:PIN domain nuclease [Egibacter rhizosphaerae]|uniref:Ribonuclease VapC n=1 Tax=Egibacter rhizosphaerae TaxID=1670831 RepID=A0A411YIA3_9ACTN|nr:PIN domain nuclease [Egibacter rhizosphaerae]QBI20871.1 PIN domain nuclease [Egibacter rhizosphaerae]